MPVLSNPKHERFAQELAKGKSQLEAYESAGYKPDEPHACRLASNGKVQDRVAEILGRAADRVELTQAWVLDRLMRNARICMGEEKLTITILPKGMDIPVPVEVEVTARDATAANQALSLLGKEKGLFIDRKEVGKPGEFSRMSEDELRDFVTREAAELGLGGKRAAGSNGTPGLRGKPH